MIIDLQNTTTSAVAKRLVNLREEGGAVALGRVLTLVIVTSPDDVESSVKAANDASREHPCRIIVVSPRDSDGAELLNAQIRVGGDAGASEVILLSPSGELTDHLDTLIIPLLLTDTPIVAWWPKQIPTSDTELAIASMAQVRITDAYNTADPFETLAELRSRHEPSNVDLAWTRTTVWRGLLAATLDQPPYEPVHSVIVQGDPNHPSVDLLAAWLAQYLKCPVERVDEPGGQAATRVVLRRHSGDIEIARPRGTVATLAQPNQPTHRIALPVRALHECLSEELRRLDPDLVYGEVLHKGLSRLPEWEARLAATEV